MKCIGYYSNTLPCATIYLPKYRLTLRLNFFLNREFVGLSGLLLAIFLKSSIQSLIDIEWYFALKFILTSFLFLSFRKFVIILYLYCFNSNSPNVSFP